MLGTSETCILLVFGYASFASAEALDLSGIIASLFCGITQAVYARPIMSWPGKKVSTAVLRLLAGLADTGIFLQIGLGLALLGRPGWGEVVLGVAALVGCLVGRAAHVFPLSAAINAWVGRVVVSQGVQVQMWWAGLRGGIAFASAVAFPSASQQGGVARAVGLVCCATIALMGPTTVPLLRAMAIPFGEDAEAAAAAAPSFPRPPPTPPPPLGPGTHCTLGVWPGHPGHYPGHQ
jgi:NhaP-type Na+/H+ or K+/H+ antiporter